MAEMQDLAMSYLSALFNSPEIPGGLAYPKALKQCNLDRSFDSLDRIDRLLDAIREAQKPTLDEFIAVEAQHNFLFLLAFYASYMITRSPNVKNMRWLSYDELVAENPGVASAWPRRFESSIVFQFRKADGNDREFLPLVPIVIRLFEGPSKSVRFSVEGFV